MIHRSLKNRGVKALLRYLTGHIIAAVARSFLCLYPLRAMVLRLAGSRIGRNSRILNISFINFYKDGFSNFIAGDNVFIGAETMIDIAGNVTIGHNTTLAERVLILTHTNVGYNDHPLKEILQDKYAQVSIGDGVFIGAGALIMPGVTIGDKSVVGAMSLVLKDVAPGAVVAGVPAKVIGNIEDYKQKNATQTKTS
ncbi:MAG TPA: acyltransferase [Nitrospirota bacterium]|nr:acyltransferase [Nitrospirota bacterium]